MSDQFQLIRDLIAAANSWEQRALLAEVDRDAALAAAFQRGAEKMREACVAAVRPKGKRPCDCDRCDCGNAGDNRAVTAWDADAWNANALRALPIPEDKP